MTAEKLWQQFRKECNIPDCKYQAWQFGCNPDELAQLVLKGEKTATASNYICYEVENEELPVEGLYNVILNSIDEAVCIIQNTKVSVVPFNEVSAEHAYKEGEGDKSLSFWRNVHQSFFEMELKDLGLEFEETMKVVLEEFKVVYKP